MNSLRMTLLLLLANLLLGLFLYQNGFVTARPFEVAAVVTKLPKPGKLPYYEKVDDGDYQAILDKPLFNEDRLPEMEVASEATGDTQSPVEENPLALLGTVIRDENSLAILQATDRNTHHVAVGEAVEGWTLQSLENETAVLVRGEKQLHLEIKRVSSQSHKQNRFNIKGNRATLPLTQNRLPVATGGKQ